MHLDFPTILFIATVITGLIWAADAFFLRARRTANLKDGESAKEPLLVEYSRSFFPVILIVLFLRSFLVEPFRIPSGSMMPTLLAGDFILVNKYTYGIRLPVINKKIIEINNPQRGDVAVFRFPKDPGIDYIKRIVGLPGDKIAYQDRKLYINGTPMEYQFVGTYTGVGSSISMSGAKIHTENLGGLEHEILLESRQYNMIYDCLQNGAFFVPEGHYFVMGDNRDHSNDSRFWCSVPDENLVGKAFMIWMNWDSSGGGITWSRIGNQIK